MEYCIIVLYICLKKVLGGNGILYYSLIYLLKKSIRVRECVRYATGNV